MEHKHAGTSVGTYIDVQLVVDMVSSSLTRGLPSYELLARAGPQELRLTTKLIRKFRRMGKYGHRRAAPNVQSKAADDGNGACKHCESCLAHLSNLLLLVRLGVARPAWRDLSAHVPPDALLKGARGSAKWVT